MSSATLTSTRYTATAQVQGTGGMPFGDLSFQWLDTNQRLTLEILWGWGMTQLRYRTTEGGPWLCAGSNMTPVNETCTNSPILVPSSHASVSALVNAGNLLFTINQNPVMSLALASLASSTTLRVTVLNGTLALNVVPYTAPPPSSSTTTPWPIWAWVLIALAILTAFALIVVAIMASMGKKKKKGETAVVTTTTPTVPVPAPAGTSGFVIF